MANDEDIKSDFVRFLQQNLSILDKYNLLPKILLSAEYSAMNLFCVFNQVLNSVY